MTNRGLVLYYAMLTISMVAGCIWGGAGDTPPGNCRRVSEWGQERSRENELVTSEAVLVINPRFCNVGYASDDPGMPIVAL